MIASADENSYRIALETVAADENVDGVIVIYITPLNKDPLVIARIVADISTKTEKPILGVFMSREQIFGAINMMEVKERVPSYMFPESAAKAMAALYEYSIINKKTFKKEKTYEVDLASIREIINNAVSEGRDFLEMDEVAKILDMMNIPQPGWRVVRDTSELKELALNFPVVVKAMAPGLIHKSDVGAVVLGVKTIDDLEDTMAKLKETLSNNGYSVNGYFIQEMAPKGMEVIVGEKRYSSGPLIMFGLGGVFVEVLKDVAFGVTPMSEDDAMEMIKSIKGYKLLKGYRGEPARDIEKVKDTVLRISYLTHTIKEIDEMDINPLIAYEKGVMAVDARIKVKKE